MIHRLRRMATPRTLQLVLLVVLIGAAVLLADAEGGRQIADDAKAQRAAESVLTSATVTEASAREAVLTARAREEGIGDDAAVFEATVALRQRLDELASRVEILTALPGDHAELVGNHDEMQDHGKAIAEALDSGDIDAATEAILELSISSTALRAEAERIRVERQAHIDATLEGIDTVAAAARLAAGLGIPALVLVFIYRGFRLRQKQVLLRAELEREKALRKKKDQFLAGASHHLNTPLSAVLGFAELLSDKTRSFNAAVRNEMIELLANEAREARHVADDLLIAARSDMDELSFELTDMSLREVLEEVTRSWGGSELGRLHITGEALVRGDVKRVSQIVRNLLRNAATHGGEHIEVTIRRTLKSVLVEISDDGEGIPPGHEEQIFQPYYSLKQPTGLPPSLGLGLSVARSLARSMRGDLGYMRDNGSGSFLLTLPQTDDDREETAIQDLVIDPTPGVPTSADISEILEQGGPEIVYQAIVDMNAHSRSESRTVGYEALARFPFASPPDWFKAARTAGKGLDLEVAAIEKAIQHFEAKDSTFLSVNVSEETLTSSRLLDTLAGIAPSRLILELSEMAAIRNYQDTRGSIELLDGKGVRIAVDDVGAEDVDLWHIIRLQASIIKIDMSLVRDIDQNPSARGLIRAVVSLGDEIGALVIAEGVETETEHEHLRDLGVEFGQGYLYGKPQPLEWAIRVLRD